MTLLRTGLERIALDRPCALQAFIGGTPLLPLTRLPLARELSPGVRVYAKAEWFNPGGSVKDRPAWRILASAQERGQLPPGVRLLDSTSGNMGIAYATLGAAMGIPVTLTIPANASPERIGILRALGAELVLTDALEGSDGAILVARELAREHPGRYWYADQYNNPANWEAHHDTTGPEIWTQTGGQVTHFVAGLGTSGTLMGVGRYLREVNPSVKIVAGGPDGALHGLEGLKHMPTAIQPGIYDPGFPDGVLEITTEAAVCTLRDLAREEGLLVGPSSGAAAWAAFQVALGLERGVVVTLFPDAGYKYLSDPSLWGGETC